MGGDGGWKRDVWGGGEGWRGGFRCRRRWRQLLGVWWVEVDVVGVLRGFGAGEREDGGPWLRVVRAVLAWCMGQSFGAR